MNQEMNIEEGAPAREGCAVRPFDLKLMAWLADLSKGGADDTRNDGNVHCTSPGEHLSCSSMSPQIAPKTPGQRPTSLRAGHVAIPRA
jgi:hypothetical protein